LGGRRNDYVWGIHLDSTIVIAGTTESSDFPVLNPYQESKNGFYDAFVCKFNLILPTTISTTTSTTPEGWTPDVLLPVALVAGGVVLVVIVLVLRSRRG
jgi:hypothetical protein